MCSSESIDLPEQRPAELDNTYPLIRRVGDTNLCHDGRAIKKRNHAEESRIR